MFDGAMARPATARFVFVTLLLDIIGIGIVIPVLPELLQELLVVGEARAAGWFGPLVSLYALMQTLCSPLLGALSDRFGRRPVILTSLAGMGLSYVLIGLAPSVAWLFVARGLAGITGATITTVNAYMADISTPETRARNFGLVGAAFGLGFVLGPFLGGVLGELGPRVPFFAAAAIVFLNALWGVFVLPESLPAAQRRPFVWREASPLGGLVHLKVHPLVAGLALALFFSSFAQRGLESVWVLHNGHRFGWGELMNGVSLAVVGVGAAIVQGVLVRRIVPALGEVRAVLVGMALGALAMFLYGLSPSGTLMLCIIPIGSLGAIAGPAMQGLVTGVVPHDRQGAVQGALASVQSLTSIVAPLVATRLFERGVAWGVPGAPFWLSSAVLLVAGALAWRATARYAAPVETR